MTEEEKNLTPPVKEGDVLKDQDVISSGKKNDGVVKYEGYIIFVSDCKEGDVVSFTLEKVLKNFGIGKKLEEEQNEVDTNVID